MDRRAFLGLIGLSGPAYIAYRAPALAQELDKAAGRMLAISSRATLLSEPVVTPAAKRIAAVSQTAGANTITVQTWYPHRFTRGNRITVRLCGYDGGTFRRHPANGEWEISPIDDQRFVLIGSQWKADPSAADPVDVYGSGLCWTGSLVDAVPEYIRLKNFLKEQEGGKLLFPVGLIGLRSKDLAIGRSTCMEIPSGCSLVGHGKGNTHLFLDDDVNGRILQSNGTDNWEVRDLTINGNRQYQRPLSGLHGIRVGIANPHVNRGYSIINVDVLAASGYGIGIGGNGEQVDVYIGNVRVAGTNSDGMDVKNRSNDGRNNRIHSMVVEHFAMGSLGTAAEHPKSPGDVGLDLRGRWTVNGFHCATRMHPNCTAIRLRLGDEGGITSLNGVGGQYCVLSNLVIKNTAPDNDPLNTRATTGGIEISCHDAVVSNYTIEKIEHAILLTGSSRRCIVGVGNLVRCDTGIEDRGERNSIGGPIIAYRCGRSYLAPGGTGLNSGELRASAFTTRGNTVTVHHPAHGLKSGDAVAYLSASGPRGRLVIGSLDLRGGWKVSRIIDAEHYEIASPPEQSRRSDAKAAEPDSIVYYRYPAKQQLIQGSRVRNVRSIEATKVGFEITAQALNVDIDDCESDGDTLPYLDSGQGTRWGPNNRGGLPKS